MNIVGTAGMTPEQIHAAIRDGARFVLFKYCFSVVVMTFRRPSDIYFIKPGESRVRKGLPYTLITLCLGWWGIPWGPIFSIQCLCSNLGGGEDVTAQIQNNLRYASPLSPPPIPPPLPL